MRCIALMAALIIGIGPAGAAIAPAAPVTTRLSIDHILLWGRTIDQLTAVMAVKLGFQVMPGRDPHGVANRYVRMADGSYLELEAITRPQAEMDPGMQADQAALHGGPGSRTFGLRSPALDDLRVALQHAGFAPTPVFSASPDDPDGEGPHAPPRWRLFAFAREPLSSHLFFIDYARRHLAPDRTADDVKARVHPNGARALSAVWLLSADAAADRAQFTRMGFGGGAPIRMPQIAARGYCVPVGRKRVYVLQPDGAGVAAEALRRGGPQVLGVSLAVADLAAAKRRVERGYEHEIASYQGTLGASFMAPTQQDLGLLVEFHAPLRDGSEACLGKGPVAQR